MYTPALQRKYPNLALIPPGGGQNGGLIFRYTNVSAAAPDYPALTVNFLSGSTAVGNNVNGTGPQVGPGKSAVEDVDAVGASGNLLQFSTCQPVSYTLSHGVTQYAP